MMKDTTLATPVMMPLSASMTADDVSSFPAADRAKQRRAEVREFKVTVAVLFAVFLPIALFSRVLPRSWRPLSKLCDGRASPLCEARAAANVIAPFMLSR
jgi:hypothetical protein